MIINLNGTDWKLTGYIKNQWRMAGSMELGVQLPSIIPPIQATVPGAVQVDLIREGLLEDPNYGLDSLKGEWVNNREWIYEKLFVLPSSIHDQKLILCFDGLDYQGEVYLNGTKLGEFEGMFIPREFDITGIVKHEAENCLKVVFYQVPEVDGQYGFSNMIRHLKSRFNYTWDWCPRIVPVGIWENVYIKTYDYVRITDFYPKTQVTADGIGVVVAAAKLDAAVAGEYEVVYHVSQNSLNVAAKSNHVRLLAAKQSIQFEITMEPVEKWWPNGQGEQPLYEIEMEIYKKDGGLCDRTTKKIGFREVTFVKNEGGAQDAIPYTLVLNGKRIFLRGINWVPLSPFYGIVTKNQYRSYLQRFKEMNCNLIRVWGGAVLEKQEFYETCDEMGLMVWQEFPQSSSGLNNTPPDDREFLKELEKTAEIFIKRRRHHVSHIIWCGGNELMWEDFIPVNERHANIKMLRNLVDKLDSGKHFLPSSASGPRFCADAKEFGMGLHHDVHGPWNYLGEADQYTFFNGDDALFRSETGCPGTSRIETIRNYSGGYPVWPPDASNLYWLHRSAWWPQLDVLTRLFGEWDAKGEEIEEYLKASRFIQAEALRYAIEAARRREPVCSGFIIWMGNEPFPNNANTSVVEYDGTPKPGYYWVRNAFSELHASAKYSKLNYRSGEGFEAEIYVTSDTIGRRDIKVHAQLLGTTGNILSEAGWNVAMESYVENPGKITWTTSNMEDGVTILRIKLTCGTYEDETTYLFTVDAKYPLEPIRRLPKGELALRKNESGQWTVKNNASKAAVNIFMYGRNPKDFIQVCPNYFSLLPREEKVLHISQDGLQIEDVSSIRIEA